MAERLPKELGIRSLDGGVQQKTLKSEARSGKVLTRRLPKHTWAFTLTTIPLDHRWRRWLRSFLNRHGQHLPFEVVLPIESQPLGSPPELAQTSSAYTIGTTTVVLTGYQAGQKDASLCGDPLVFAGHNKVYEVAADADADGTGRVSLSIWPPLKVAVGSGEQVRLQDVPFTVRLDDDPDGEVRRGLNTREFDVVEY